MINTENYSKQNLNEIVVRYIKDKILSGELKRGDHLKEMEIASDLAISRAPLREALRELNVSGLVTFSPRKGNKVLDLTLEEAKEVFEIRISLELQVLNILVRKKMLTGEDFAGLFALVEEMRHGDDVEREERDKLYLLNSFDIAFHSRLWRLSGSVRRSQYLESLFYQLMLFMNKDTVSLGTFQEKADEHEKIVEALKLGNLRRVHKEFTNHLRQYMILSLPSSYIDNLCTLCGLY